MEARIIGSGCMFEAQVQEQSFNLLSGKWELGRVTVASPCFTWWVQKEN